MSIPSSRLGYLVGLLACVALLAFALYLQYVEHQDPCPLCLVQRVAFMGLALIFLIAAIHGPRKTAAWAYSAVLVLLAAGGGAVAARQVWLQSLPKNMVPECGPGLEYMLERFPFHKVFDMVLRGSGECAEVGWKFLGLSIAGWSLVWFVLLGALAVASAVKARGKPGMFES
jgi:disulfide bond formation protein DsbB